MREDAEGGLQDSAYKERASPTFQRWWKSLWQWLFKESGGSGGLGTKQEKVKRPERKGEEEERRPKRCTQVHA